jgi:tight adherence protein B
VHRAPADGRDRLSQQQRVRPAGAGRGLTVRRSKRLLAGVLGLTLLGVAAPAAVAQDAAASGDRLVLRAVDSHDRDNVELVVSYGGDADDLDDVAVELDGSSVDTGLETLEEAGVSNDVVFVIDASESTDPDGLLTEARQAVERFVADLPASTRVAIVAGGTIGQTTQRLTADVAAIADGIADVSPDGQGGVFDALALAGGLLRDSADDGGIGTVVLFTDGAPAESIGVDIARGAMLEAGAVVHVVGLDDDAGDFDASPFQSLAESTGGTAAVVSSSGDLAEAFDSLLPELSQLSVLRFASEVGRGVLDLTVSAGGSTAIGSYVAGGDQVGPARLRPRPADTASGPAFLRGDGGRYLAYGGVLLAAMLFAFGLGLVFVRDDAGLNAALMPYSEGFVAGDDEDGEDGGQAMAQTALLRRAVEATESFAERQGFLTRVERTLEKADIPLRAGEAMFFYLAAVLLIAVATLALLGNPLGALISTGLLALLVPAIVNFRAARKKKHFEALLPDTLQLLSSTLRAGYSMMQGVEAVSQEASEPMGKELRRVVTEARLGRPLEESLDGIAERMESGDFAWAVMAIRIQREVGGNLSELLLTVAETMTERERLRRDINSLTAEGRMSAYVLGLLPIGLGGALFVINPDYMGKLFDVQVGQVMLGAAVLMMGIGFAWMFKIIKIDI